MSSFIDMLTEYWMVDVALLLNSYFVVLVVYLVVRLETPRMSCMSTPLFDTGLICLKILDPAQPVIESGNQPYKAIECR